jgi:Right handed beta helix region
MTEDDGFNIVGAAVQGAAGTEIVSASEIRFVFKAWNPFSHPWSDGDSLLLLDPATYQPVTRTVLRVASRRMDYEAATGTFIFLFKLTEPAPELAAYKDRPLEELPFLAEPGYASAPYVIRNSCFRDSSGGRLVVQSGPGLIEGNVIANVGGPGIELSANPYSWREGPGAVDVTVRGNVVVGAGYWLGDYDMFGRIEGRTTGWLAGAGISVSAWSRSGFIPKGAPNGWLRITGNTIVNSPGLGILVSAASNVRVDGNLIVNANALPFAQGYDATFCGARSKGYNPTGTGQPWCLARTAAKGAIMVTHARSVDLNGNRMQGTSTGVFVDRDTVD